MTAGGVGGGGGVGREVRGLEFRVFWGLGVGHQGEEGARSGCLQPLRAWVGPNPKVTLKPFLGLHVVLGV